MSKNKQLIFIDDSGDPGFKNYTNSSKLVMASAVFVDKQSATMLNFAISSLRNSLGWKNNHEFKFRKTHRKEKEKFLRLVTNFEFEIYAVYIDKSKYPKSYKYPSKRSLYNWTTRELLKTIPLNNANITLDGKYQKEYKLKVQSYLRHGFNVSEKQISKIKVHDSAHDNLIQLADMIAGTLNRFLEGQKTDSKTYYNIIKKKIVKIREIKP